MMPGAMGWTLLAYLLVILPWLAWRTAQQFKAMRTGGEVPGGPSIPARTRIFAGTLYMLVILYFLAWMAGGGSSSDFFWYPALGKREILAGVAVLVAQFLLRWLNRRIRTQDQRPKMAAHTLLPRTGAEWALFLVTAIAAGIAEETAYRGVGMFVLTDLIGNPWIAAVILAIAFGLAHLLQEWKSVAIIILMALLMHALVQFTGALVVAMAVHALYDIVAGVLGAFEVQRLSTPKLRKTVL